MTRRGPTFQRRESFGVLALATLGSGCFAANITAPHQAYAPLLDHAGQLDVSARGGMMENNGSTVAAQVAYAPLDNLELAANVDADFDTTSDQRARHLGGGVAVGTFTRTKVLRFEALTGINFGHAEGQGFDCEASDTDARAVTIAYELSGPYIQPFIQTMVGFEVPYFELAGGMRLFAQATNVAFSGSDGTAGQNGFARVFIEPIFTIRVPFETVRLEVLAGWPLAIGGDSGPLPDSGENLSYFYLTAGIGLQLDTTDPPLDLD